MKKGFYTLTLLLFLAAAFAALAAESIEGRFSSEEKGERVYLKMRLGKRHNMGFTVSRHEIASVTPTAFELRREAGTIRFEGPLGGSGSFTFAGNPDYVREMASRGHDGLDEERLFELASFDLTLGFVDDMARLGYEVSLDRLVEFRIHGVSPDFVEELVELGYDDLSASRLVEFRIHGVKPDFVREMTELGYDDLSASQLVEMRIHGVSPSYVRKLAEGGETDLSARELVERRIHGRY